MMRIEEHKQFLQSLQGRQEVQAVVAVPEHIKTPPFHERAGYLVIVNSPQDQWGVRQLLTKEEIILEQQISVWELEKGMVHGLDENLVTWILRGEVVWDKNEYLARLRQRLHRLPESLQKRMLCREYSRVLHAFQETRDFLQEGMILDAYHSLFKALYAWAKWIVYHAGEQPESAIWSQVKNLDPSLYKLYEELTINHEELEKRVELILLPLDFFLSSRLKESVRYLIEVMETRTTPWKLSELAEHTSIARYGIETSLLIEKMVQKSLLCETVCVFSKDRQSKEIGYFPAK
ncbi:nucleotidyltransferase-like protein [Brevibacillus ruminantium]|uniref:Nucleotidyltransferase-like protein n=1 Tax=Brevibacillus ruminantium TaxID=2950604 RepID=A0ABY4WFD3_9BACL|nr:nucleotidyltransferase-like protein [Brevibacillus ruminantium]USG64712.1 nucleotidyltransferase-like protein [Brevibacillus ruminantium]